jgi:hypothetical protein
MRPKPNKRPLYNTLKSMKNYKKHHSIYKQWDKEGNLIKVD